MNTSMVGISLAQLLEGIGAPQVDASITVTRLVDDHREVVPGACFVALKGEHLDGHDFIEAAIDAGAAVILAQHETALTTSTPIVVIDNLDAQLGVIAHRFYGSITESMRVIGVTGTNGKTSVTHFIAQALALLGRPTGLIGTLGIGLYGNLAQGRYTTPKPIECHRSFAELKQQGAEAVAMEVSSHGLDQHRVAGIGFDVGVFTNLTHDHLDYHGSMEAYWAAKRKLFEFPTLKTAIINIDDPYGVELAQALSSQKRVITLSVQDNTIEGCEAILAQRIYQSTKGIRATISTPWGDGELVTHLLGRFNVSNLLAALAVMQVFEISVAKALPILARLDTVPGRMQCIRLPKKPLVVVDYAHTPDALEQALLALRPHASGQLWCVFGCGGGRDREKRAKMGQIAERFSDQLVITNDNPRDEDPEAIVQDILQGMICTWAAEIELDRGAAIANALNCAQAGDIILIAGKGHEQYQQIGAERIAFNDVAQVKMLMDLT